MASSLSPTAIAGCTALLLLNGCSSEPPFVPAGGGDLDIAGGDPTMMGDDTPGGDDEPAGDDLPAGDDAVPPGDADHPPRPLTTLAQTVAGVLPLQLQINQLDPDIGRTTLAPGEPYLERCSSDVDCGTALSFDPTGADSLFYLAHLTDVHIRDEESPTRLIQYDALVSSAWAAEEAFSPFVFEAMLRTFNRLALHRPMDRLLISGDFIDNNQYNELRLFIDILDGATADPDSGDDDDPRMGPSNDAWDAFEAEGLAPEIGWLVSFGNHDTLVQGNSSAVFPNGRLTQTALNLLTGIGLDASYLQSMIEADDSVGNACDFGLSRTEQESALLLDPRHLRSIGGEARCRVKVADAAPGYACAGPSDPLLTVPADPDRRLMTAPTMVEAFLASTSEPAGHGFTQSNVDSGRAYFGHTPRADLPVRIISLDTTSRTLYDGLAQGTLERDQLDNFLEPELRAAEAAGELVVVMSHHCSEGLMLADLCLLNNDVTANQLRNALGGSPNVVAHLCGHSHTNEVRLFTNGGGQGYFQIQAAALYRWPMQGRLMELVDTGTGELAIYLTMLDFTETGDSHIDAMARAAVYEAVRGTQTGGGGGGGRGQADGRNVILRYSMPAVVAQELADRRAAGGLERRPVEALLFPTAP